jgi:hypothetical protein
MKRKLGSQDGDGGERFVGEAARASGGEAHDLHCRNIRRRTAEAALAPATNVTDAGEYLRRAGQENLGGHDDRLDMSEKMKGGVCKGCRHGFSAGQC